MFERILLPVDVTEDMDQLVDTVAALAAAFDGQVTVLHLRERTVAAASSRERETMRESVQFGERVADELRRRGVRAVAIGANARPDNVGRRVLEKAAEVDAKLIVIGGHHAHNIQERLLGDIGKVLAHGASCPVMMLPSPPH